MWVTLISSVTSLPPTSFFLCQVLEDLRMQLGFEVVPILRNRQSLFFFGESPFDSFGPVPPPTPDYSRDLLGEF